MFDILFQKFLTFLINIFINNYFISKLISKVLLRYKGPFILFILVIVLTFVFGFFPLFIHGEDKYNIPFNSIETASFKELSLKNTDIPIQSPFGGIFLENTKINAYYKDSEYFKIFGIEHTGLDIVPNDNYYRNNKAYLNTKEVNIFATCNGKARSLIDSYGANYIYLKCSNSFYHLLFVHNKRNLVKNIDQIVETGEPIAIMGATGKATGAHLHYEIRLINSKGGYQTLNPLDFIK